MKQLSLLIIVFLFSNFLFSQEYEGTVHFRNGSTKSGKVEIPAKTNSKKITFNGSEVESKNISRIDVSIIGAFFTFAFDNYGMYNGKKKLVENKRMIWCLKVNSVIGDELEFFITSNKFKVNKKGRLIVEGSGNPALMMNVIKKKNDHTFVLVGYATGGANFVLGKSKLIRNMINGYLSDCEKVMSADTKELTIEEICNLYNTCY